MKDQVVSIESRLASSRAAAVIVAASKKKPVKISCASCRRIWLFDGAVTQCPRCGCEKGIIRSGGKLYCKEFDGERVRAQLGLPQPTHAQDSAQCLQTGSEIPDGFNALHIAIRPEQIFCKRCAKMRYHQVVPIWVRRGSACAWQCDMCDQFADSAAVAPAQPEPRWTKLDSLMLLLLQIKAKASSAGDQRLLQLAAQAITEVIDHENQGS